MYMRVRDACMKFCHLRGGKKQKKKKPPSPLPRRRQQQQNESKRTGNAIRDDAV